MWKNVGPAEGMQPAKNTGTQIIHVRQAEMHFALCLLQK